MYERDVKIGLISEFYRINQNIEIMSLRSQLHSFFTASKV